LDEQVTSVVTSGGEEEDGAVPAEARAPPSKPPSVEVSRSDSDSDDKVGEVEDGRLHTREWDTVLARLRVTT
jgi:hypothetical protein